MADHANEVLAKSLRFAWSRRGEDLCAADTLPPEIANALEVVMRSDSPPARQMLLAILSGTVANPSVDPAALQRAAGLDRRSAAAKQHAVLAEFFREHALTTKLSQDPGVSNPWRQPQIDAEWVSRRKGAYWESLLKIVQWLKQDDGDDPIADRAYDVLNAATVELVQLALGESFAYPRFQSTPRMAMELVAEFLERVSDRPDATEAVVASAARVIASQISTVTDVERGDTNSPDAIDIVIRGGDSILSAIEVTDEQITLKKLRQEIVGAMQIHGISRATVVCRPPRPDELASIEKYLREIASNFGQLVDLISVDDLHSWLAFPGISEDSATRFIWEIGEELDRYSKAATRRTWLSVLNDRIQEVGA